MRAIIEIDDPINWHTKCEWVTNNCPDCIDKTEWAAWQIGFDIIRYEVYTEDAVVFKLMWDNNERN